MDIARLIESSFSEAVKALAMGTSPGALARARERAFVKTLSANLEAVFNADDQRVFAAWRRGNAPDFGANQLLCDIAVCRVEAGVTAERKPEDFLYVSAALLAIEVDFSREWRSALYAVNRLNCAAARTKLLIAGSPSMGAERLLRTLRIPASASVDQFCLALVPHPADWDDEIGAPQVWRLSDGGWQALT